MKVLHLVGFYPEIGGPFTVVKELSIKLSQKGVEVKVLSPIPKGYDRNKLDFVKELPFEVEYVEEQLPRWIMPSFSLKFINRTKNENFDIIHIAMPFDFYNIAAYFSNKSYIISLHGTFMKEAYKMIWYKKLKKDLYMKIIGKRILEKAKIIHLITEEEREHFLEFYPEFEEKLRIIPNGIDLTQFEVEIEKSELLKKYPQLKDKKVILFLSRINWKKGLDLLIPAFAKLYSERKDVHLLIVGKDDGDNYESKVKNWVREYNLEKAVTFTGLLTGRDKLTAFYGSDFFVLPSYSEGLPTAVIEAMASGLPVVVSDKVGITREIKRYDAGIIVNTTVDSVYRGLKYALETDLSQKVENAKKMVKELYDIERVVDKVIAMYEEALRR
jgi:glycosyltransferase involved in cell wall biosynthesis